MLTNANSKNKFYLHEVQIIADSPLLTAPQLSVDTVGESAIDETVAQALNTKKNSFVGTSLASPVSTDSVPQSDSTVNINNMQGSGNNSNVAPKSELYKASKNIMPSNENKINRKKLTLAEKQTL